MGITLNSVFFALTFTIFLFSQGIIGLALCLPVYALFGIATMFVLATLAQDR